VNNTINQSLQYINVVY